MQGNKVKVILDAGGKYDMYNYIKVLIIVIGCIMYV